MCGHGNHWETLYDVGNYIREQLAQDCEADSLVGRSSCVDLVGGTARGERVACLRHGGERFRKREESRGLRGMVRFGAS